MRVGLASLVLVTACAAGDPAIEFDPPGGLAFDVVEIGQTKMLTLGLHNTGNGDAALFEDPLQQSVGPPFVLAASTCGASLAVDARCEATIAFAPAIAGESDALYVWSLTQANPQAGITGIGGRRLSVTIEGDGRVTSPADVSGQPPIFCGTKCTDLAFFDVALTAEPFAGSMFVGWGGDAAEAGSAPVVEVGVTSGSAPIAITATFAAIQ